MNFKPDGYFIPDVLIQHENHSNDRMTIHT